MAMSDRVESRLRNWKFESAQRYIEEESASGLDMSGYTENEDALITALAECFGNCGYFSGQLAEIVRAAVSTLLPPEETGTPRSRRLSLLYCKQHGIPARPGACPDPFTGGLSPGTRPARAGARCPTGRKEGFMTTAAPPSPYAARVEAGAALLNETRPAWMDEVDPGTLSIDSASNCVLGQLYEDYDWGRAVLGLDRFDARDLGFTTFWGGDISLVFKDEIGRSFPNQVLAFRALTEAWQDYITRRREDQALVV